MSNPKFEDYEFEIRRITAEDGGGYTITFPDLPGCRSDGETPSEAEENGRDAFNAWIEACIAEGRDVPNPGSRDEAPARFLQRVPKYIHAQLIQVAKQQGVSVNSLVQAFIAAGLERLQMSAAETSSERKPITEVRAIIVEEDWSIALSQRVLTQEDATLGPAPSSTGSAVPIAVNKWN